MLQSSRFSINHLRNVASTLLSAKPDFLSQQTRNTFILKRRQPVWLHKKNHRPHKLKPKHFIYDLVEDTDIRKDPEINLILTSHVEGVGKKGDIVTLSSQKAYYNLLLPRLAIYATPENIAACNSIVSDSNEKKSSSKFAPRTIKFLSTLDLSITMSMHAPWTLEKWHIRVAFRKIGVHVPEDAITMPTKTISGPNLDLQEKQFYVTVTINNMEEVKVKCRIHHWTDKPEEKLNIDGNIWDLPIDPIFLEDRPILESLPKHCLAKV